MIAIGSNFFYTVTLPCTLWFLDKGKAVRRARKDTVLFIDARNLFTQLDRAHREFSPNQLGLLAALARLYRGEDLNGYTFDPSDLALTAAQRELLESALQKAKYADVPGLCKVATRAEIEAQGWSLNPGRYVGVSERDPDDFDFIERIEELNEELEVLNNEAKELEDKIAENVNKLLGT